jgi:hypothetical protein
MALVARPKPITPEVRAEVERVLVTEQFQKHVSFGADLQKAFEIWDAVVAGVRGSGNLVGERKVFEEADAWLAEFR